MEGAEKPSDVFTNDTFTEKILVTYLRRFDCRSYSKLILKKPVLRLFRENFKLCLDVME